MHQPSTFSRKKVSKYIYILEKKDFADCRGTISVYCKGSAWAPAFAGTHASGWAGQRFELFDSILDRVIKVTTHNHSLHVQYVM